jgi:hypothetical protein
LSIDTTFKPSAPAVLVGVTAVQVCPNGGQGVYTFRVVNSVATIQAFTWGKLATVTANGPPAAGLYSANTIVMLPSSVETFEIPADSFFIGNTGSAFYFHPGSGA